MAFRNVNNIFKQLLVCTKSTRSSFTIRSLSHYPIDDNLFGLTDEQKQVVHISLNSLKKQFFYFKKYCVIAVARDCF